MNIQDTAGFTLGTIAWFTLLWIMLCAIVLRWLYKNGVTAADLAQFDNFVCAECSDPNSQYLDSAYIRKHFTLGQQAAPVPAPIKPLTPPPRYHREWPEVRCQQCNYSFQLRPTKHGYQPVQRGDRPICCQ